MSDLSKDSLQYVLGTKFSAHFFEPANSGNILDRFKTTRMSDISQLFLSLVEEVTEKLDYIKSQIENFANRCPSYDPREALSMTDSATFLFDEMCRVPRRNKEERDMLKSTFDDFKDGIVNRFQVLARDIISHFEQKLDTHSQPRAGATLDAAALEKRQQRAEKQKGEFDDMKQTLENAVRDLRVAINPYVLQLEKQVQAKMPPERVKN